MSLMRTIPELFSSIEPRFISRAFSRPLLGGLSHQHPLLSHPFFSHDPFTSAFDVRQPAIDVHETDSGYEVQVEVPGVPKENISCEIVDGNTLVIGGGFERSTSAPSAAAAASSSLADKQTTITSTEDEASQTVPADITSQTPLSSVSSKTTPKPLMVERVAGSFCRSIMFPTAIDQSKISANLADGVLRLQIPKQEHSKTSIKVPIS
eukprot:jgi/Hompol1/2467/HPOL_000086-RA